MNHKSITELHTDATALFLQGVRAVAADLVTEKSLECKNGSLIVKGIANSEIVYDLAAFKRILVIGFGKAAGPMAYAVQCMLEDRITEGVVLVKHGAHIDLQKIELIEAGHPIPDANSLRGAQRIAQLAKSAGEKDLVICLISGGGSALCALPSKGLTLDDLVTLNQLLLKSGADINEINVLRKHTSQIKGGQLARMVFPATLVSVIISDVVGDRIETIASGPTAPDITTFKEAYAILEKYELLQHCPASIRQRIEAGVSGRIAETPRSDDRAFRRTKNIIIAHNLTALRAIAERAEQIGYQAMILSSRVTGDTRKMAYAYAAMIKDYISSSPHGTPSCVITGGEMTVRVTGKGKGGRNSDFCLALVPMISSLDRVIILAAGTDGTDGSTDAAGAIIDNTTFTKVQRMALDINSALTDHDSYTFFTKSGNLLTIGPTHTNVMDIQLILVG